MMRLAKVERKIEYFPILGGEIKATNDSQGIVEGYLNYIGNIDYGDDRTMKGAFRKTIRDSYERKSAQGLDFLWPYLFNHDYSQLPPGGIYDADETSKGLYIKTQLNLDMQMGRELYASFKLGTMQKQSMGYKAIQVEYVKDDETKRTIRNLLEVAVMEGSAVVFPMNDLAQVDTVKNLNKRNFYMSENPNFDLSKYISKRGISPDLLTKGSASGKTSWPLADRNTTWDAGQARKDIEAWAGEDTGKMAQCFFWVAKSPPEKLGDCKLPFVAKVGGTMKAVPQGIISCAGVLQGAMGGANIDDVDAVKAKVASYYHKMSMKPPWEKGKGNVIDLWSKDYTESYQMMTQQDWVSDLWNLWYPLRNEILQAFITGDTPVEDVTKAIQQFTTATINYVQRGVELNMTECLQPDDDSSDSPMPGMYMSADDNPETKAGRMISEANHAKIAQATDGIMGHVKAIKGVLNSAAQRANDLQGYPVYPTSSADPTPEQKTDDDAEPEEPYLDLHTKLHDLASLLTAANADRGL
jgi:HK97 family phage prohead protease